MKKTDHISDELVNSFVDEQLSAVEKSELLAAINADEALSAKVCDAQRLKALVSHAYQHPPHAAAHRGKDRLPGFGQAAVAALMLAAAGLGGWFGHAWWDPVGLQSGRQEVHYLQPGQLAAKWTGQQKVVLHLGSSDPGKLKSSLDQAEQMLNAYRKAGREIKMELIVSSGGLDLLRADVTPYAARIRAMKEAYGNLAFVACGHTIDRLRERGVKVDLLPEAKQIPDSALDIVISRLQEGWTYASI